MIEDRPSAKPGMNAKHVYLPYYYLGLILVTVDVFAVITDKVLYYPEFCLLCSYFAQRHTDPFAYYVYFIIHGVAGLIFWHQSLLFIPAVRENRIRDDGFDRRVVGLDKPTHRTDPVRITVVVITSVSIIAFFYWLYMVL